MAAIAVLLTSIVLPLADVEAQPMPSHLPPTAPDHENPPRARDGDIAIRQEFEAAALAGTAAALELFIARNPDHALAAEARARLAAMPRR
ncbi:MAG: hypothetical protein J0H01_21375 [Rhizobiales bacterium]|nr:hypothetical protein [Hyphomicrobiales bacterium]